ncbi:1-3-beta-glucanosyltransferase gel4 [Apiospora kogelbergensis]|uniref:1-3-beta-glucanosyltransferase gel4 n=1 Tax=Apiospora kogelbergensis TaxID=1337665 RepID=UPI0031328B5F
MGFLKAAVTSSLLLAGNANAALDPIVQKGAKLFYKTSGEQFFMKGIAYQQEFAAAGKDSSSDSKTKYIDPLSNLDNCKRDVPILKDLHTNVIRTYAIDPKADHKECMDLLEKAGIYVIADLGEPALSINRDSPVWNVELFDRYKGVIDEMGKYTNTIGFFAGNEVTNNNTNTPASAFVKAAVRDTKKYIKDTKDRWMGVGYAANDDAEIRINMAQYFNCGKEEESIDFWGYNIYSWCGDSSFTKSGYDTQVEFFSNYSVPVFFAEYGCNSPGGADGRKFDETKALYSSQMTDVISGGIVYMYFEEDNDYGLVKVTGKNAKTLKNADNLKKALSDAKPVGTTLDKYQPSNKAATCPKEGKEWKSLECQPSSDLKAKNYGDIFDFICSKDAKACAGIKQDTEAGVYGPYLGCNAKEQLGHVLNAYYKNQKGAKDACDFKGQATLNSSPSTEGKCSKLVDAANSAAAAAATATSASQVGTISADGTTSKSSDDASPANALRTGAFSFGGFAVGAYMVAAMGVGAGMLAL